MCPMSGRVGVEQTPDIETVLAEVKRGRCLNCLRMLATDEDWENTEEGERPDLCWENNVYSCGWVAETTLEALQAAALAPVLAAAVREGKAEALHEAQDALYRCPRQQCRGRIPHSWFIHWFGWARR